MFIYIGGPYSVSEQRSVKDNIKEADRAGQAILQKGHMPFIPHTMMANWEGRAFDREKVRDVCYRWLERCEGFLYLGSSPGADEERKRAEKLGMKIFERIDDIPSNTGMEAPLQHKVTAYLTEYQQCQESYRHTYQTIWQAGAILIAASALIITFWDKSAGIAPISVFLAPIPFLIWWWAIFRPMDGYGRVRQKRLEALEAKLNGLIAGLDIKHFLSLKEEQEKERNFGQKIWHTVTTPRVHWAVNLLGVVVLVAWIVLSAFALSGKGPFAP